MTIKRLTPKDCTQNLLEHFERYQEVKKCWRKENGAWKLKDISFIEQWDTTEKSEIIDEFIDCLQNGGVVLGAFKENQLIGFSSIINEQFGTQKEYIQLATLYVSAKNRNSGLGRKLFAQSCLEAVKLGGKKLYISAHSSEETQAFYKLMGCRETQEINKELFEKEPYDCHLEYSLL